MTSASTLTMTTCLPASMAASAWRVPAIGWPVASMTHSISSQASSASTSSVTKVVPFLTASAGARRGVALLRPADAIQRFARLADVEIGDGDHVIAGDPLRLRQHHGAELAGADHADPHGTALGGAGGEKCRKVHWWLQLFGNSE